MSADVTDVITSYLLDRGALGFELDDQTSIGHIITTAYFDSGVSWSAIENQVRDLQQIFACDLPHYKMEILAIDQLRDRAWQHDWEQALVPVHASDRLVIRPSWTKYQPEADKIVVVIDPGMAFGTGYHSSTILCVQALEKLDPQGRSVLDYGCGTGILAISAVRLGAARVLACDNDPLAIEAVERNAKLNSVKLEIHTSDRFVANPAVDIVVANLDVNLLTDLFDLIDSSVESGGYAVLSGITGEEKPIVLDLLTDRPYRIQGTLADEEWVCFIARKEQ